MVLLGVVIGKCETPTTNISQENGHGMLMIEFQYVPLTTRINSSAPILVYFLNLFDRNIVGIYLSTAYYSC